MNFNTLSRVKNLYPEKPLYPPNTSMNLGVMGKVYIFFDPHRRYIICDANCCIISYPYFLKSIKTYKLVGIGI